MNSNRNDSNEKLTDWSNNQRVYDPLINGEKLPSSCMLCPDGKLNKRGHIIPKLVMRWLKKASKKEKFYLNNTEMTAPDTMALRILCDACEEELSRNEKIFTDMYFNKYYRGQPEIEVNDSIYYFSLSVAWRILITTPMMRSHKGGDKYFSLLRDKIKSYLLKPNNEAALDVYVFHGNEIAANLPERDYNINLLRHSIRQGIFCQPLFYDNGFCATLSPFPLVHFKLGIYYFIVSEKNYLQSLKFDKILKSRKQSRVHSLKYSTELIGFLSHISNGDFHDVVESAIPNNISYDVISSK
ncbi:hypothetical protein [Cupriavidus basilensis]